MNFMIGNGLTTHYRLDGTGRGIPLVLINALGTDLRIWDDVVPHLTDRDPILRFDKRGYGLSDCPAAPYSIHDFSTDLPGLLDKLEISQAIIVGIFVGGMIAMDFAVGWPERVHSMDLCDTAPVIGTSDLWNDRINGLREHGMGPIAEAILARWSSPAFKGNLPPCLSLPRAHVSGVQVNTLYPCSCGHCQEIIRGYSTINWPRKERESA